MHPLIFYIIYSYEEVIVKNNFIRHKKKYIHVTNYSSLLQWLQVTFEF